MSTVTEYLHRDALNTLRTIAPERKDRFREEFDRLNISFVFDTDAQRIRFAADLAQKTVIIGPQCLDRLWAICFAYYRFYRAIADHKLSGRPERSLDLRSTPELREAGDLLKWAVESDLAGKRKEQGPPWPAHLPRPSPNVAHASDEHCATELFLCAVAFLLHHEFAHLRMAHSPYSELESVDAILQEKEADFEAAAWILGELPDELAPMFQKRALGVGLGLVWIASLYVYAETKIEHTTHPPAYDRLFQVMEKHIHDGGNLPWAFVQSVLALHLQNQGIPHDADREFESFKDAADHFVDVISKMFR